MAYLIKVIEDDLPSHACPEIPHGPGFDYVVAEYADRMEVWGTKLSDDGGDWTEFRLYRGSELLAKRRIGGY